MYSQNAPLFVLVIFLIAVYLRAQWLKMQTDDIPCTYRLFAVRDALIRLVAEKKIDRDDPHFLVMYSNVNTLLTSSRLMSGPKGWPLAALSGYWLARNPRKGTRLQQLPPSEMPISLRQVSADLEDALNHLVKNHFGILLQMDTHRREAIALQRKQAKQFLDILKPSAHRAGQYVH